MLVNNAVVKFLCKIRCYVIGIGIAGYVKCPN